MVARPHDLDVHPTHGIDGNGGGRRLRRGNLRLRCRRRSADDLSKDRHGDFTRRTRADIETDGITNRGEPIRRNALLREHAENRRSATATC